MSEKKYTVVLLNDGGITSEMINAINVVMGSFNMFLGGSESIRSDGSYILAKDVSEDIAYALKQGIEASGGQVEIFDDKTNTETVTSQQHQDYSTNSSLNHHSQNKKNTTENKKSKIFEEIKKSQKEHISDVDEDKKKVFKEFKQKHYKKADELVKRNQEILQHLADRMEYIRIQSEEKADIETLAHDSRMQDNQFAQSVRQEGYVSASKVFSDEAREMAENDKKIKQFVLNEYGEAVRVA